MDTLKNLKQYSCTNCNFITRQKNDYTRHLLTAKHIKIINSTEKNLKNLKMFKCDCGKEYKFSQGLSKHKKNCDYKPIEEPEQQHIGELTKIEPNINMFIDIIKENQVREPTVPLKPLPLSETNHSSLFNNNIYILLNINHSDNIKLFVKENC